MTFFSSSRESRRLMIDCGETSFRMHCVFPVANIKRLSCGGLYGWLMGFEPMTLWTTTRCSNQLSYSHHVPVAANE